MANQINVSTQVLRNTANGFSDTGSQIRGLTQDITSTVTGLGGSVWEGTAATSYVSKFQNLQQAINKMDKMIQEHVEDLQAMASEYEAAENTNASTASSLNSNVI